MIAQVNGSHSRRKSIILDASGNPITRPGKPRAELIEAFVKSENEKRAARRGGFHQGESIEARYDAAQNSDEFKNYWAAADSFDADSANSPQVRRDLVSRSRYDLNNNGYSFGIAQTYATDLIGVGPTLRMQTGSENFNRMVELAWWNWTQEIQFRRKLWCLAHAKHGDGEGFGVVRQNRNLRHPVKLDLTLHETEQCQTPYLPFGEPNRIDGIIFDDFGNPVTYEFLRYHPGSNITGLNRFYLTPEQVAARYVLHWYKLVRPGQHRGIPECTSTLNCGAAARRFREATIAKAETQADFTVFLETQYEPDELDSVTPMSTLDIQKRMLTALPNSVKPTQLDSNTPGATYAEFHKSLINEQARPKSMPYNKAACDSSSYNYASGRLDHQTYYGSLDVEREDCNDLVLNPLFDVWFDMAIMAYGWLGGDPDAVSSAAKSHAWDWPKHQVADIKSEAAANDTNLKNGSVSLSSLYSLAGKDYEDDLVKQAESNGVTVDQQRQINMLLNLPQHVIPVVSQMLGLAPVPAAVPMNQSPGGDKNVATA